MDVGPPAGPCCHSPLSQRPGRRRKTGRVHPIVPLVSLDFVFSYTFVPHRDSFQRDQAIISLFAHPRGRLMDKQFQYEALPPQIQILDQFARERMETILNYDSYFLHPFVKE